jgi:hypothetical protein
MNPQRSGNITARPSPLKPESLQLTYETADSRRTIDLAPPGLPEGASEPPPHGAGSYHDPEQHRILLDRVEALMRNTRA